MKTHSRRGLSGIVLVFVCVLMCSACLSNKSLRLSDTELYQLGTKQFSAKKYIKSRETFSLLVDYYPDSSYAAQAQLLKADAYFKEGNFIEAGVEYNLFLEFHPAHAQADYALFQEAECYYTQIRSIDRDQTNVRETVKKLKTLLALYPASQYVTKAEQRIAECQKLLHDHSLYVARFYHNWDRYISSIERYNYLLSLEPPLSEGEVSVIRSELAAVRQDYYQFLLQLSDKSYLKGQHYGVIASYEKLLEYFPEEANDETVWFKLARSYQSVKNYDKAKIYFMKIIDSFPSGVYAEEAREQLKQIEADTEETVAS